MNEQMTIALPRISTDLEPQKTALILVDYQNDFLDLKGAYAAHGVDISHMRRIIPQTKKLIAFCRKNGIPIIVLEFAARGVVDGGAPFKRRAFLRESGLREGSWGTKTISELGVSVEKNDWFVRRNRMSGFYGTRLEGLLRNLGRDTVLISGVVTMSCCESTARDASFRDYRTIVLSDLCGAIGGTFVDPTTREDITVSAEEMHRASLRQIAFSVADVATSEEIMEELTPA